MSETDKQDDKHRVSGSELSGLVMRDIHFTYEELEMIQDIAALQNSSSRKMIDAYTGTQSYCDKADELIAAENKRIAIANSILKKTRKRFDEPHSECIHPNCTCDDYCMGDDPYSTPTPVSVGA